ncbi:MAG: hypothetical protein AAFQ34_13755, partial [Pseudomonadota bacterium]
MKSMFAQVSHPHSQLFRLSVAPDLIRGKASLGAALEESGIPDQVRDDGWGGLAHISTPSFSATVKMSL